MATKLSLKLLVDKRSNKVLFGEAGKDFVDFLLSLLLLPIGSVTRLLNKETMVGCLGNLYGSVEKLGDTYIQPSFDRDLLLKPQLPSLPAGPNPPLLLQDSPAATKRYYSCVPNNDGYGSSRIHPYITEISGTPCPSCQRQMTFQLNLASPPKSMKNDRSSEDKSISDEGGLVKGVITYMVMDDLVVTPMSTISSIALLNKFNIEDIGLLEEKVVEVGFEEGLALLKASLQSEAALTDVFLGK